MKIAVLTDDKKHVAEHFGSGAFIIVATVEGGKVIKEEERSNPGHDEFAKSEHHPQTDDRGKHGFGAEAEARHKMILEAFKDCDVLIVNMIGTGAYNFFTNSGLKVVATDVKDIDEAIALHVQGKLQHTETHVD